jgi:hypothetical protein
LFLRRKTAPQIKLFCAEMPRSSLKKHAGKLSFLRRKAAQQINFFRRIAAQKINLLFLRRNAAQQINFFTQKCRAAI